MPRTCLACSSSNRTAIDEALVAGEPLRNIAKRVAISPAALFRHKQHVSQAIVKAADQQEERHGLDLLGEVERVRQTAWELLGKMESEGDHRGSVVALREVRECLESQGEMLAKARNASGQIVIHVVYDEAEIRNTTARVPEVPATAKKGERGKLSS
jgi:hypothetical protein